MPVVKLYDRLTQLTVLPTATSKNTTGLLGFGFSGSDIITITFLLTHYTKNSQISLVNKQRILM